MMSRKSARRWVEGYERAWRTEGTDGLAELFTDDATYRMSPWAEPVTGLAAIRLLWEAERAGPDEEFTMTSEVVAVDGDRAVIRVDVDYERAGSGRWRDLWLLELTADGRCRTFEEWPFAPSHPDGH